MCVSVRAQTHTHTHTKISSRICPSMSRNVIALKHCSLSFVTTILQISRNGSQTTHGAIFKLPTCDLGGPTDLQAPIQPECFDDLLSLTALWSIYPANLTISAWPNQETSLLSVGLKHMFFSDI